MGQASRGDDELQRDDDRIAQAAERLVRARKAQGLPLRITDPVALDRIASLIDGVAAPAKRRRRAA